MTPRPKTRRYWLPCLLLVVTVLIAVPAVAQSQPPLTLEQIIELVQLGVPDAAIAKEISTRGLAFVPTKAALERLRGMDAGPETLKAIEFLAPMVDEARQAIPEILDQIYQALNEGNPSTVRHRMSPQLAADTRTLDFICRPFTYRVHYVETVIERSNRRFEVRVRALFEPFDERAYILVFGLSQGNFYLVEAKEPADDWFGPQLNSAAEIVRRFVYAVSAGREETVAQLLSPSLARMSPMDAAAFQKLRNVQIEKISHQSRTMSYKGLKLLVYVVATAGRSEAELEFILEGIDGELKIVGWQEGSGSRAKNTVEDPQLEAHTLARFGLSQPSMAVATPGLEEYFDVSPELRRWEYSLKWQSRDRVVTGKKLLTQVGERNINGRTYVRQIITYSGGVGFPFEIHYERRGPEGLYVIHGDDPNIQEYLQVPFPVRIGVPWTDPEGRTYRIEGIETIDVNGKRYEDCLKLTVSTERWESVFYISRELGIVRGIQKTELNSIETTLLSVKEFPPGTTLEFRPQRLRVRHRHLGIDPSGRLSAFQPSYCEGELSIIPWGDIQYLCTEADTLRNRCERVWFSTIKEVKLREGGLRITSADGGNWDFYGSDRDIQRAYEAITASLKDQKQN